MFIKFSLVSNDDRDLGSPLKVEPTAQILVYKTTLLDITLTLPKLIFSTTSNSWSQTASFSLRLDAYQ